MADHDLHDRPDGAAPRRPSWAKPVLIAAIVVLVLTVGALVGYAVTRGPEDGETVAATSTDDPADGAASGSVDENAGDSPAPSDGSADDSAEGTADAPTGGSDPHQMLEEYIAFGTDTEARTDWLEQHAYQGLPEAHDRDGKTLEEFAAQEADAYDTQLGASGATPTPDIRNEYYLSETAHLPGDDVLADLNQQFGGEISDFFAADLMHEADGMPHVLAVQFVESNGVWYYLVSANQ
ncbi:hypothetical protein CFRA_11110 [Corynebacterium frankenforstense DSM 45800]|uniref:Uncharacterized protein n=1 Tax=Corynebacterium frankenforstense DSM 45800 TaxID=1437875 RepID=A0A1L7CV21_9CORY|nr:hypothetical protein [Corynebacterium frankenforstense]APT89683.1 hypothetical protein CFRA_11110 [Corynebacterium frankenforstense DSM 45800]